MQSLNEEHGLVMDSQNYRRQIKYISNKLLQFTYNATISIWCLRQLGNRSGAVKHRTNKERFPRACQ